MNGWTQRRRVGLWCMSVAAALVLAACGGGDSGGSNNDAYPCPPGQSQCVNSIVLPASAGKTAVALPAAVRPAATKLVLPEWTGAKQAAAVVPGKPLQVGAPRALSATATVGGTSQALHWVQAPDGGQVAALSMTSTGAYGMRLGVVVGSLPDAAQIRVYRQDRKETAYATTGADINQVIARNVAADGDSQVARTWWSPDLGADEATLEIALPAGVPAAQMQIAIPTLAHAYVNLALPTEAEMRGVAAAKDFGDAGSCELDASCANQYATERNAVARMTFMGTDRKYYYCTGTLLNNTRGDYTPYFLSANHCVSTQTSASSLRTDWFFRSASCNSLYLNNLSTTLTRGATLLYATAVTDTSLMQLNEKLPAGVTLAGWDARGTIGTGVGVYALHQPVGDLLKYSEGQIQRYDNCTVANGEVSCSPGTAQSDFFRVGWSKGVTEGGSSGSAIFASGRVVGTLSGGSSACTVNGGTDDYGRFDHAFNNKLKNWLAQ